jgi:hypothetical protein
VLPAKVRAIGIEPMEYDEIVRNNESLHRRGLADAWALIDLVHEVVDEAE